MLSMPRFLAVRLRAGPGDGQDVGMAVDRHLDWEGCWNARDLGGLPTPGGRTRRGAVVRSDGLEHLTPAGWAALHEHGIRTVLDLRNPEQVAAAPYEAPFADVEVVRQPLEREAMADPVFTGWLRAGRCGTPLYYSDFLERWPGSAAAAIERGGRGPAWRRAGPLRDREGPRRAVALLLLALAGVGHDDIADDHSLSVVRLAARWSAVGPDPHLAATDDALAAAGTTSHATVLATLASLDPEAVVRRGSMTGAGVAAVRRRLAG